MQLNQKGNSLLFVLVCIPVVLSFLVLVIDISRHQSSRDEAQTYVDNLALQAGKFLPSIEAASNYINLQIGQQGNFELIAGSPKIEADNLVINLQSRTRSLFDVFLASLNDFESTVAASIRIVPNDVAILIPDGVSLRPNVGQAFSNVADWPASAYFNTVSAPSAYPQSASATVWQDWWNNFNDESYRRWITQSCYNPIYSSVKDFAINLYSNFSNYNSSRAFALFYPGEDPLLGYSFASNLNYWEVDNYIGDELCVLLANQSSDTRYSFYPNINASCSDFFILNTAGRLFYPRGNFSDCAKNTELKVEELIYYHASKNFNPNEQGLFNALHAALTQMVPQDEELSNNRANLNANVKKEIILIVNQAFFDLNRLVLHWQSIGADQLNARLSIVPVNLGQNQNLIDLHDEVSSLDLDWLKSFYPEDHLGLVNNILPEINSSIQQVVLSR